MMRFVASFTVMTEHRTIEKSLVAKLNKQTSSFFSEDLLTGLSDQRLRDLIAYLASDGD